MNFVSLPDGALINVNTIAYILPIKSNPPKFRVYLTALATGEDIPQDLAGELAGEKGKKVLQALQDGGMKVENLVAHMNPKPRSVEISGK